MKIDRSALLLFFSALLFSFQPVFSQNTEQSFGHTRIQYKNFDWKTIRTENFEIFYYQGGTEIAQFAARYAESDFQRMTDLLGYTPYSKIKLFIYNSIEDLQQSNVGLSTYADPNGGKTNFIKSRAEIAFPGNQFNFQTEIRSGVAQLLVNEMMFGGSLKEMLSSAYLLALPEWFISGIVAYAAEGYSLEMDDNARDIVSYKKLRRPSALTGVEAAKTGHIIWNFIAERYGKSNISNILNLTRIIRNEETSIASTLGLPYGQFLKECRSFYTTMADNVKVNYKTAPETKRVRKNSRKKYEYNNVELSADGKNLAYTENKNGRYKIYVLNIAKNKKTILFRGGRKVISQRFDPNIPLIGWRKNNSLVIIYTKAGKNYLRLADIDRKFLKLKIFGNDRTKKLLDNFNQISSFSVSEDGTALAISADKKGQNDVFIYKIFSGSTKQVTNDFYDDLYPGFLNSSNESIIFSSNRLSDTLSVNDKGDYKSIKNNFDLFLSRSNSKVLERLTLGQGNEMQASTFNKNSIFYLGDETGISQLYKYDFVSKESTQLTDYQQNIKSYSFSKENNILAYRAIDNGNDFVAYKDNIVFNSDINSVPIRRIQILQEKGLLDYNIKLNRKISKERKDSVKIIVTHEIVFGVDEVDTENYKFDADTKTAQKDTKESKKRGIAITTNDTKVSSKNKADANFKGPYTYKDEFSIDNTVTSVQIDPIRGLGIVFNVATNDMLEDHKFNAGASIFVNSLPHNNNVFLEYQYLKQKVDFGAKFERKSIFKSDGTTELIQRFALNKLQVSASYPLNNFSRIVISPFYTTTRYVDISFSALDQPDAFTQYGGAKLEYIFDNTTYNGLNMIRGTRAKVKFETYNGLENKQSSFTNFLIDIRHYEPVHRDIIFATRLSSGRFAGNSPKTYAIGGMDNWLFNAKEQQDKTDPVNAYDVGYDNRDILFTEFVTPLRGFNYNKLFGNNFVLFNAELRFPIIKYFYRSPITSNFFRNLQFVAFTDIGAAWKGKGILTSEGPFGKESVLNSITPPLFNNVDNKFAGTTVNTFKNPFLTGYGVGLRTLLLGFYAKGDVAWGVEDKHVSDPKFYLTLGYDF